MAEGAIEAMSERGLEPGFDVILGGVDASPEAIELIKAGKLAATIGGHFQDGGRVAVLLYDYLHGVELKKGTPARYMSEMNLVTQDNSAKYEADVDPESWKRIDFHRYSRHDHPELKKYWFEPEATPPANSTATPTALPPGNAASSNDKRNHE
jgi:hypothetical protein